jgi:hypothetical protein
MRKESNKAVAEREILRRNPQVNRDLVESFKKLESEVQRLGADTRPHFGISPPLGGCKLLHSNG